MERLIELMESRIRRNVYVRFGGEHLKTYHSNMARRWVLSLHNRELFPVVTIIIYVVVVSFCFEFYFTVLFYFFDY